MTAHPHTSGFDGARQGLDQKRGRDQGNKKPSRRWEGFCNFAKVGAFLPCLPLNHQSLRSANYTDKELNNGDLRKRQGLDQHGYLTSQNCLRCFVREYKRNDATCQIGNSGHKGPAKTIARPLTLSAVVQEFQTRSNVGVDRTWIGGFSRFLSQQSRKLHRLKPRFRAHLESLVFGLGLGQDDKRPKIGYTDCGHGPHARILLLC